MPQGPEDIVFSRRMGFFDYVKGPQPIKPHKGDLATNVDSRGPP